MGMLQNLNSYLAAIFRVSEWTPVRHSGLPTCRPAGMLHGPDINGIALLVERRKVTFTGNASLRIGVATYSITTLAITSVAVTACISISPYTCGNNSSPPTVFSKTSFTCS